LFRSVPTDDIKLRELLNKVGLNFGLPETVFMFAIHALFKRRTWQPRAGPERRSNA
jgi:hypothetical protein